MLGQSLSLPMLALVPNHDPWLEHAMARAPPPRPLTPLMQTELASIAFNPRMRFDATAARKLAANEAAKLQRKAKHAPGPKMLRISGIACEDLPDSDKGMGGGTSDPYLTFYLVTDRGEKEFAKTATIMNAPRDVSFPDVIEMPLPMSLLKGYSVGTLVVKVWDDDSVADGQEGVNADDLMGQNACKLNCRLTPYKLEGHVDRATFSGVGSLYAFRVSFRYEAVPLAEPDAKPAPSLASLAVSNLPSSL